MVSKKRLSGVLLLVYLALGPVGRIRGMESSSASSENSGTGMHSRGEYSELDGNRSGDESGGLNGSERGNESGDDGSGDRDQDRGSGDESGNNSDSDRGSGNNSGDEQDYNPEHVAQLLENAGAYPVYGDADIIEVAAAPMQEGKDMESVIAPPIPTLLEREQSFQAFMALPDRVLAPHVNGTNKNGASLFNLAMSFHDTNSMLRLLKCGAQTDTSRLQFLMDRYEFKIARAMLNCNTVVRDHVSVSWETLRNRYLQDKKRSKLVERIFENQIRRETEESKQDESSDGEERDHVSYLQVRQVQVMPHAQEIDGNGLGARAAHNSAEQMGQDVAVSDEPENRKKVSFLPAGAKAMAILCGGAWIINYFKIDRFWDQYL